MLCENRSTLQEQSRTRVPVTAAISVFSFSQKRQRRVRTVFAASTTQTPSMPTAAPVLTLE